MGRLGAESTVYIANSPKSDPIIKHTVGVVGEDTSVMVLRLVEDLYFRLNVFPMTIPPLRERIGDIPSPAQHFIQKKYREMKLSSIPPLTPGAIDRLMAYHPWPGNVRELENVMERALIFCLEATLTFSDLHMSKRNIYK